MRNDTIEVHECNKCGFVYESPIRLSEPPCHACNGRNMRYTTTKHAIVKPDMFAKAHPNDLFNDAEIAAMHERASWDEHDMYVTA